MDVIKSKQRRRMIQILKRERKMAGKSLVLNTSGLVKICAFFGVLCSLLQGKKRNITI